MPEEDGGDGVENHSRSEVEGDTPSMALKIISARSDAQESLGLSKNDWPNLKERIESLNTKLWIKEEHQDSEVKREVLRLATRILNDCSEEGGKKHWEAREKVVETIWAIGGKNAARVLIDFLKKDDVYVHKDPVVRILGRIGQEIPQETLSTLKAFKKDPRYSDAADEASLDLLRSIENYILSNPEQGVPILHEIENTFSGTSLKSRVKGNLFSIGNASTENRNYETVYELRADVMHALEREGVGMFARAAIGREIGRREITNMREMAHLAVEKMDGRVGSRKWGKTLTALRRNLPNKKPRQATNA
ncbi:MAG: hypothetical protein ABIG39_03750 [Candidatus Micrarchaeota archaeon]